MTMSQQDKERLLRTLQDDPVFLAQVRSLILPAELVQLPERFAQFATHVTGFIERQEEFNADFRAFIQRQEQVNARQEEFNTRQEEFNTRQEEFNTRQEEFNTRTDASIARLEASIARQDQSIARLEEFAVRQEEFNARQADTNASVEARLQRITDDLGDLKGNVAGRIAREMADDIAEQLGYEITQQLSGNDLRDMLRGSTANDIPAGVRRSFYVADLVAKVQDHDGNQLFIAVEASYTADERDTQRAVRNAELIGRFTGMTAVAVVASLENDHAVQQLVEDGHVQWFQFQSRDLQPQ